MGLTETQTGPSNSTYNIIKTLTFFNINFNENEYKFLILAYACRNNAAVFSLCFLSLILVEYLSLVSRNMLLPTEYSL